MGLPCRHILKARTVLNLSCFDKSLCSTRWTVEYYNKASKKGVKSTTTTTNLEVLSAEKKKCSTLTQAQKFRRAMDTARSLATLASEGGMQTFNTRMADLQNMLNLWQTQNSLGTNQSDIRSSNAEGSTNDLIKPTERKKETEKGDMSDTCTQSEQKSEDHTKKELKDVKMPPKMLKRGRPKGAELTVIGLPRTKKAKKGILPFSKVRAEEKDRILLECFVRHSVANKAIQGEKLISVEVETNIQNIPDMVRDKENVVLSGIEKYFVADAWKKVLNASEKKNKSKWMCPGCSTSIRDRDKSIVCERCLYWYHVSCTSLKGPPKAKNWFCCTCKAKHL